MKQQHNAKVKKLKLLATRPVVRKHTQCTRTQRMLIFHASKHNKMQPDAINSTKKKAHEEEESGGNDWIEPKTRGK